MLACALFVLALLGSAAYELQRSRRETQARAATEISSLARLFAEQTRRALQTVDIMLRAVAVSQGDRALPPLRSAAMHRYLAAQREQFSDVVSLFVLDAEGTRVASSAAFPAPGGEFAERRFFRTLSGSNAGRVDSGTDGVPFVDAVFKSPRTGRWEVVLARRLNDANGRFAGAVAATLDIGYFDDFYAALALEPGEAVALLSDGGELVASHPRRPGEIGQPAPEYQALLASGAAADKPVSVDSGVRRLAVLRAVPNFAMNVLVTRDDAALLAPWREQALGVLLRTAALAALTALLLALLLRRLARQEAARARQKLEAIGTLAGGIAHDFNNILGAIRGFAELARGSAVAGSAQARQLDGLLGAAQRARALVDRILAFGRAGMGERGPVHVQAVVDEVLEQLLPTLPADVRLTRRLDAGGAAVSGDASQIHQLVMNLCTNAVQAMPDGGTLDLALTLQHIAEPLPLLTGTLPAGDYLQLVVGDSGGGIEPQVMARMFEPFFTTKGVGAGTGLGLSVVHGIVGELGGGIAVSSRPGEPGGGARFVVYLPQSGTAIATPRRSAPVPQGMGMGMGERILLIDHDPARVALSEDMLASLGFEPVGFVSPIDALAAFRASPDSFDAVLLSGSALAAPLRLLRADLPIVLISGPLDADSQAHARAAGVSEVLSKPLTAQDIARCLGALLHR